MVGADLSVGPREEFARGCHRQLEFHLYSNDPV